MVDGLLEVARALINHNESSKPKQAFLRRGISTAYYAVYHEMSKSAADAMLGAVRGKRPNRAWAQLYRGFEHGHGKTACEAARNIGFPQPIKDCADAFVELQKARHDADYDPNYKVTRAEARALLMKAEFAIKQLRSAPLQHRAAFGVHLIPLKRR